MTTQNLRHCLTGIFLVVGIFAPPFAVSKSRGGGKIGGGGGGGMRRGSGVTILKKKPPEETLNQTPVETLQAVVAPSHPRFEESFEAPKKVGVGFYRK